MLVPPQINDAMIAHARFCYPKEACGLIAGNDQGLRMAYCLTNVEASPTRYTIDPTEHFRALRHAEAQGWELVAVFHSHPHTEAYPSPTDVQRALEPNWLYFIVGLADPSNPRVRGFWIRDGSISEEHLLVGG